jgi:Cu-Zn family superoxide dismutase
MFKLRALFLLALLTLTTAVSAPGFASGAAATSDTTTERPSRYVLPGDAVFPEGITYQRETRSFYVSSTADGTIFRGNLREEQTSVFLPGGQDGRTTAVGLKVDDQGRLFIAGGVTGRFFVYNTADKSLLASFTNNLTATFVNDVAVARDGSAYVTDSAAPFLYKVSTDREGKLSFETWLDFTGTPFVYQQGFNANGIVVSRDDRYLVIVQSNTGKLFRIDTRTKEVTEIDLGGETLTAGDGLLLQGKSLYVVRNQQELIVEVRLADNFSRGKVVSSFTDPSFAFPTTIARAQGRLLVVNSQFDRGGPGLTPELPFTVSSVPLETRSPYP